VQEAVLQAFYKLRGASSRAGTRLASPSAMGTGALTWAANLAAMLTPRQKDRP